VKPALTRYRVMAYVTGVFLLLLCLNMILKYALGQKGIGNWVPITHGWLYMVYVVVAVDLWFRTRLDVTRTVFVVLAGTIPFASFFAERWVTHQVQPMIEADARGAGAPAAS
jgi:integral membrane protein